MPRISKIDEVPLSCQSSNLTENHSSALATCTPTGRACLLLLLLVVIIDYRVRSICEVSHFRADHRFLQASMS